MTTEQELEIFHKFFHKMQLYSVCCNSEKVREGVDLIFSWSYAHRTGNGELGEEEQQILVNSVLSKMKEYGE